MTTATADRIAATSSGDHELVHSIGRVGIISRGVIYLVLAYLTFDIAGHGNDPAQATSTGALQEVGHRGGGSALLVVLAVGLGSYAIWRLFSAVVGGESMIQRLGSVAVAVIYFGLLARAIELAAGHQSSGGASANPQPLVSGVMGWPAGRELLGLTGIGLIVAGLSLALWGIFHRYAEILAFERVPRNRQRAIRTLGALGELSRGFLIALVGAYLIGAAMSGNSFHAKGIDQALKTLVHHSYGAILIGLVAVGLLCFGLYSFCEARLRRF